MEITNPFLPDTTEHFFEGLQPSFNPDNITKATIYKYESWGEAEELCLYAFYVDRDYKFICTYGSDYPQSEESIRARVIEWCESDKVFLLDAFELDGEPYCTYEVRNALGIKIFRNTENT